MKSKYLAAAAAATLVVCATSASADPITYTFTGTFSGVNGGPFTDVNAVFTGIGDTNTLSQSGLTRYVNLSSLSAVAGGLTYNISTTTQFYINGGGYAGLFFGSAGNGGGAFSGTGPGLSGYNGISSISTVPFSATFVGPVFFQTDRGDVTIDSFSNGSFSASVAAAGAVPEPATWAMLILGMGAVGFALRRKKVTTTVRYA